MGYDGFGLWIYFVGESFCWNFVCGSLFVGGLDFDFVWYWRVCGIYCVRKIVCIEYDVEYLFYGDI